MSLIVTGRPYKKGINTKVRGKGSAQQGYKYTVYVKGHYDNDWYELWTCKTKAEALKEEEDFLKGINNLTI